MIKKRFKKVLAMFLIMTMFTGFLSIQTSASTTVFSQLDSRWASYPYGYGDAAGTTPASIETSGCGVLALVNAIYYLNGSFIQPKALADFSLKNGCRVNGDGTISDALCTKFGATHGAEYGFSYAGATTSLSNLKAKLQGGYVAVGSSKTIATGNGHIMAVVNYDSSTNKFLILDSAINSKRFGASYSWQTLSTSFITGNGNVDFRAFSLLKDEGAPSNPAVEITAPVNDAWLSPSNPGSVTISKASGVSYIKYAIRELWRNPSTGVYEDTDNLLTNATIGSDDYAGVKTTSSSFSLDKSSNSNLKEAMKSAAAYRVWVGAFSSSGFLSASSIIIHMITEEEELPSAPKLLSPEIVCKYSEDKLYIGQSSAEIDATSDLLIKWEDIAYSYMVAAKILDDEPNPGENEKGTFIIPYSKYTTNKITLDSSDLEQYAGKWIKVAIDTYTSSGNEGDSVYYYFRLAEIEKVIYTTTFNANGGSVSPSSEQVSEGDSISLPTPTRSFKLTYNANGGSGAPTAQTVSLSCKGWATRSTATSATYECGEDYTPTTSRTLYAVWNTSATATVKNGIPENDGYTFLGWSEDSDVTAAEYEASEKVTLTSNLTLYAVWEPEEEVEPTLTSISISTKPTKLTYEIGESLSTTGMVITATYSDGSKKPVTGYTTSGFDSSTAGTKTVSVTYQGNRASFTVKVEEAFNPGSTVLSADNKTAASGSEIRIPVTITGNAGFMYLKMNVSYDSTVLSLKSVENGTVSTDSFVQSGNTLSWDSANDATNDGLLVTLVFAVDNDTSEGDYTVNIKCVECYNSEEQTVEVSSASCTVTVSDVVCGDTTGDGNVDGRDLIRLRKYLANYNEQTGVSISEGQTIEVSAGADANGDGQINGLDLVRLRKYLANYNETTGTSTVVLGS